MHNQNTSHYEATSSSTRAGFASLAATVTFSVLACMAQIAAHRPGDIRLARVTSASSRPAVPDVPLQVVVVTGKRA